MSCLCHCIASNPIPSQILPPSQPFECAIAPPSTPFLSASVEPLALHTDTSIATGPSSTCLCASAESLQIDTLQTSVSIARDIVSSQSVASHPMSSSRPPSPTSVIADPLVPPLCADDQPLPITGVPFPQSRLNLPVPEPSPLPLPASSCNNTQCNMSSSFLTSTPDTHQTFPLPENWQVYKDSYEMHYCKIAKTPSGVFKVITSVIVYPDFTWTVFVMDKKVPKTCDILTKFPDHLAADRIMELITTVHTSTLCPGNPDDKFIALCKKRGGIMRGERGHGDVIANIDNTTVIDSDGKTHCCSVRRFDCDIICKLKGSFPVRCKSCATFRSTLRAASSREQNKSITSNDRHTSASSHTCYSNLTAAEKDQRLKNLHHSIQKLTQKNLALEAKLTKHIETQSLQLKEKDASDINSVVADMTPLVEKHFPSDSPQRIFWDQQLLYNSLKDKKQMRWHPYMIRFALNLKYLSTSAYRAARLSGVINLPSERTLSDYTHWTTPHTGVQFEFIEEYKRLLADVSCGHYHTALSMDEMKIKCGLVFDKHHGTLVGFTDLGGASRDIELLVSGEKDIDLGEKAADQVLVFLARAVFKPSLSLPIAHYFTLNIRGDQIFPVAWEVVEALEMYDVPVVSLTSDGAKPNRKFYRMCQRKGYKRKLPYKARNPYSQQELYFVCDVPHLLKTARNCFSNSFSHSKSRKMQKNGQDISWKSIEHLFLTETSTSVQGLRMCHKLTKDHVWLTSYTRMRVYLAAQVMSESVANALELLCKDKTTETRIFIRNIDKFFDCLNVKSPLLSKLKRKDNIAPYESPTDERFKWLREDFLQYLCEWEEEAKSLPGSKNEKKKYCLSSETIQGMKITVHSFTELAPQLLELPGVEYLLSEVFSQDPLERYFSRQRHRGGHNDNPTAYQVPYSAATLVQQKSVYRDLKSMNVEPDNFDPELLNAPLKKRKRSCKKY